MYKKGESAYWRAINKDYTGVVVGFYKDYAVVRIDGSEKSTLLDNRQPTTLTKNPDKAGGPGESPGNRY